MERVWRPGSGGMLGGVKGFGLGGGGREREQGGTFVGVFELGGFGHFGWGLGGLVRRR